MDCAAMWLDCYERFYAHDKRGIRFKEQNRSKVMELETYESQIVSYTCILTQYVYQL